MELTRVPHPILGQDAKHVAASDLKAGVFATLIADMRTAMAANNGIGLAANQVGRPEALFIIEEKLAAEHGVPSVYANPEITEYGKEVDVLEEGCLSIPGCWVQVIRAKKIMFKALDATTGARVKFRARGMLARVLQHETDHLYGTTIRDRAGGK
jgi:peptide deformylase